MGAGLVTAIVGTDTYLAETALEKLLQAAVGEEREGAVQVLRGEECTWAAILDATAMRSLFVDRRAVVVRAAEATKGEGENVAAYLDDPTPGVTLVLMAVKPDRRRTVWKRILDKVKVVPADPLRGARLRTYVVEELRRRRLAVADEGVGELVDRVGGDLRRLMGEVDKLEAFGSGGPLSGNDVAKVVGRGLGRPLYVLGDAIGARNRAKALEELQAALDDGEKAELLLATLHRSLRQVRRVRQLVEERESRDAMARRLGLPPNMAFKVPALIEASKRWTDDALVRGTNALAEADRALKSGAQAASALAWAVASACGGGDETARRPPRPHAGR